MATHAPITGAPTRAPASDIPSVSWRAADAQGVLGRLGATHFGIQAALDDFGTIEDDNHRRLTGLISCFVDLQIEVVAAVSDLIESIEIDARAQERGAR